MRSNTPTILHTIVAEAPDLAPTSRDKYRRDIDAWIDFAGANPAGWTRYKAQAFYNGLLTKVRPQSANRLWASVAYAARWWAIRENNPDLNFAVIQKRKQQGAERRESLSPEAAIALLNTTRPGSPVDLRDCALIMVGLETGMRRMSLVGSLFENIKQEPYPRILVPIKGKGIDLYSVPLSDAALRALAAWRLWLDATRSRKTGPVFRQLPLTLSKIGQTRHVASDAAISGETIREVVRDRALEAGIGHVHPHIFRHTFVTWRTELDATDAQIAAVTGHSLRSLGALGGYKDLMKIGATSRLQTPSWIAEWRP